MKISGKHYSAYHGDYAREPRTSQVTYLHSPNVARLELEGLNQRPFTYTPNRL